MFCPSGCWKEGRQNWGEQTGRHAPCELFFQPRILSEVGVLDGMEAAKGPWTLISRPRSLLSLFLEFAKGIGKAKAKGSCSQGYSKGHLGLGSPESQEDWEQ